MYSLKITAIITLCVVAFWTWMAVSIDYMVKKDIPMGIGIPIIFSPLVLIAIILLFI